MNKLWVRLSLMFTGVVLVAVLIVVATGLVIQFFEDDHERFAGRMLRRSGGLVETLEQYYADHQSWDGVQPILLGAQTGFFLDSESLVLADSDGTVLYHRQPELVGKSLAQVNASFSVPLVSKSQPAGFLGSAPITDPVLRGKPPPPFFGQLVQILLALALVGGVTGIVFGIIASRTLTAPLNNLADAAKAIGKRDLSRRVPETGTAEMVAVARSFNEMAVDLEQAEQLRRNLLADVAHELRTPLSVLQGNLRAILDEVYPLNLEEAARLYEHSRLLSRLVNDLHELAQAEARQLPLDMQSVDLNELVHATTETFRPGADAKGVALRTEATPGLPPVQVDAGRMRQVLQNLLANALRHTPAGGQITVRTFAAAQTVSLSVADTGDGIAPEHLLHVFDRFYRADPARSRDKGGAGLGLPIARAIVQAHRGQITAASDGVSGHGTTFTIQLPQPESAPG